MRHKHRHKHQHKHKTTSISYGRTKANSKENSFCFVFVNLRGKFILCYFAYAYVASENLSISKIARDKFSSEVYEDKAERILFWIRFFMLMLVSDASVNLFVLSFVLPCAYAYSLVKTRLNLLHTKAID